MSLTTGERVISRARSLMRNKGYGWSKAIAVAADTLDPVEADTGLTSAQQRQREATSRDFYARVAELMDMAGCSASLAHRAIEATNDGH